MSAVSTVGSSQWGGRFTTRSLFGPAVRSNRSAVIGVSTGMCGLFGVLRAPGAGDPGAVSDAFVILGALAERRGRDAAGVALFTGRAVTSDRPPAGTRDDRRWDLSYDGCRLVKGRGPFSRIWRPDLLALLDAAPVALGVAVRAARRHRADLAALGPVIVPGAPSGSASGIVGARDGGAASAAADGDPLFRRLADLRDDAAIAAELGGAPSGRAALAWVDRARPDRVRLARGALSPLAVAVDAEQNLYWASDPRWFRQVERHTRVRFATAVMLREGTYLRAGLGPPNGRPHVLGGAGFTPAVLGFGAGEFAAAG